MYAFYCVSILIVSACGHTNTFASVIPEKGQAEAVLMKTNRDVSLMTTTTIISSCPYQRLPL